MTQINITINLEDLKEKVENSSLESPVKSSLSLILNSLMEKKRDEYINAFPHERTIERKGQRNGYYGRKLITGFGSLSLEVPGTRDGEFYPSASTRFVRNQHALEIS